LRRRALGVAISVALGAGALAGLAPLTGGASSHREAPLVAADPQVDNTDVYAFVSPDKPNTVTLISNWIPFEEPAGGPNFYAWAENTNYDIKIDNDHDAVADIIYRWKFTNHYRNEATFLYNTGVVESLDDPDLNFYQTYDLRRINVGTGFVRTLVDDAIAAPSDVGDASMPNYRALSKEAIYGFGAHSGKTWVGQADDPFFLDLRVFDLLYGPGLSEVGDDTLAGFNVSAMALRVPKDRLAEGGDAQENPIIGVWSVASRPNMRVQTANGGQSYKGELVQVSRLGMPLVNEVVIPVGQKDRWNASRPLDDGQFLQYVNDPELPHLLNAIHGLDVPDTSGDPGIQRDDLIAVFLTGVEGLNKPDGVKASEQLRLNMSIDPCEMDCSTLGVIGGDVAGFPNGRRLSDDVIDVALQVVAGELAGSPNDLGDGVDDNDVSFKGRFPYLAGPHSGSDADPH
jgi:hypothetical protein